jgi:hypothetical protein
MQIFQMTGSSDPVYTGVFIIVPSEEFPGIYESVQVAGNN